MEKTYQLQESSTKPQACKESLWPNQDPIEGT